MNIDELKKELTGLADFMDNSAESIVISSKKAQELIYKELLRQINQFEISDGRFVLGQNYAARMAIIQQKIENILGKLYTPSIREYLADYEHVDDKTIDLHKSYNELQVAKYKLTPARRIVYDQAEYFLTDGLADAYIQPAKYLLMQAVTTGITIKEAESVLKNWNEGNYVSGKLTSGRQVHRLQAYTTQVARDSIFQYSGTMQNIISKEYDLTKFIYVGGVIEDSRPLCKHLVGLNRKIDLEEMPPLIKKYPDGLYPNTTKKNWMQLRAGYNCRHTAMPVKD